MALLHRFLRLNDAGQTGIFTFIVTQSVTRDVHRDVISKEFSYGYQKWSISFARQEKSLGVYLVWRNPSDGMKVVLDFSITLLNRHHYSDNQIYAAQRAKFSKDTTYNGSRKFVQVPTLEDQGFMDRNGEFQLEFTLSNIHSSFEHKFRINQSIFAANASKVSKLETSYFTFGFYDWSLSVYPTGRSESQIGSGEHGKDSAQHQPASNPNESQCMAVYLNRHTGLDRTCRVRFNIRVGGATVSTLESQTLEEESEARSSHPGAESGIRDEISNADGRSLGWISRVRMSDCIVRGVCRLAVEMMSVNTVTQVDLPVHPPNPIGLPIYDKDKLAWDIEPDMNGETLRIRIIHKDAKNIPRNHIRYVSWTAFLLKKHLKLASALGTDSSSAFPIDYTAKLPLDQKMYFMYYVQDDTDDGLLMDTKIPIKEILDPNCGFLMNRSCIRLHVEWLHSCLLFQSTYSRYDDVTRIQTYQMRQDIQSLRVENEDLERQLVSCEQQLAEQDLDDDPRDLTDEENRRRVKKKNSHE